MGGICEEGSDGTKRGVTEIVLSETSWVWDKLIKRSSKSEGEGGDDEDVSEYSVVSVAYRQRHQERWGLLLPSRLLWRQK